MRRIGRQLWQLPLTLILSPQAGRGDGDAAAMVLRPVCGEKLPAGG